jgi:hypothetical protein
MLGSPETRDEIPIRGLVVDDSAYNRRNIADVFRAPHLEVERPARPDGEERLRGLAIRFLASRRHHARLEMPRIDVVYVPSIPMSLSATPSDGCLLLAPQKGERLAFESARLRLRRRFLTRRSSLESDRRPKHLQILKRCYRQRCVHELSADGADPGGGSSADNLTLMAPSFSI